MALACFRSSAKARARLRRRQRKSTTPAGPEEGPPGLEEGSGVMPPGVSLSFLSASGPGQEPAITASAVDALGSDGKGLACRVVGAPPGGAKFKTPVTVRVPLDTSKAPPAPSSRALYKPDDSSPWGPLPAGVTIREIRRRQERSREGRCIARIHCGIDTVAEAARGVTLLPCPPQRQERGSRGDNANRRRQRAEEGPPGLEEGSGVMPPGVAQLPERIGTGPEPAITAGPSMRSGDGKGSHAGWSERLRAEPSSKRR